MIEPDKIVKHPSGKEIVYNDERHEYTVDNIPFISVTTLLGEFFPKFDADRVSFFVARKEGKTKEEVLEEWGRIRDEACDFGNLVHNYLEAKIKDEELHLPRNQKESRCLHIIDTNWDKINSLGTLVDSEKIVASLTHKIAGTVDAIARDGNGDIVLIDWKTNKKIEKKSKYSKKALDPISHLNDANYTKYSLQLNLYKYIIESEGYGRKVSKMYIVHVKPRSLVIYEIADMQDEIKSILESRPLGEINEG